MNRSACVIQMLTLLHARGCMSKEELAMELGVNSRNISEYRKELEAAGYRINTTSGKYGGYSLEGDALLPVQRFQSKERKALQEALTYLKVHPDFYLYEDFRKAMDKVLSASSVKPIKGGWYLNDTSTVVSKEILAMMELMDAAIEDHKVAELEYKSMHAREFQKLKVHPYEILNYKGSYYCLAYSLKSKDYRNYKFSRERMRSVTISEQRFNRDPDFHIQDHVGTMTLIQDEVYELDLHLFHETALLMSEKQIGSQPKCEWIDESTLHYHTTMEGKMETISFLLSLGNQCHVMAPQSLREEIQKILQDMTVNYNISHNSVIIIRKEK